MDWSCSQHAQDQDNLWHQWGPFIHIYYVTLIFIGESFSGCPEVLFLLVTKTKQRLQISKDLCDRQKKIANKYYCAKMTWCKNTVSLSHFMLYIHRVATVKILDCCHSVFVLLCSLPCNAEENGWDEAIRRDLIVCQSNQKYTHTALFAFYIIFASFCIDSLQF